MTKGSRPGRRYLKRLPLAEAAALFRERTAGRTLPSDRVPVPDAAGRVTAAPAAARQPAPLRRR